MVKYVHFPIEDLHPGATLLARAVSCLEVLGVERLAYDLAYQPGDEDLASKLGRNLGIDPYALRSCVDGEESAARIEAQVRLGRALGVSRTPTTVLGDSLYVGVLGRARLRELLR